MIKGKFTSSTTTNLLAALKRAGVDGLSIGEYARDRGMTRTVVNAAARRLKLVGLAQSTRFGRPGRLIFTGYAEAAKARAAEQQPRPAPPPVARPALPAAPARAHGGSVADRALVSAWLAKNRPTICPPCGVGHVLPHYDNLFVGQGVGGTKRKISISFDLMLERRRFARAAEKRQQRGAA